MRNFIYLTSSIVLFFFNSIHLLAQPNPRIISDRIEPSVIQLGESFSFSISGSNNRSSGVGYLSISFPDWESTKDSSFIMISSMSAGLKRKISLKNQQIKKKDGSDKYAEYALIDFWDNTWERESKTVKLSITPDKAGSFRILYRMTFESGESYPTSSSKDDQQGWKVYEKSIMVQSPPPIADIISSRTKVSKEEITLGESIVFDLVAENDGYLNSGYLSISFPQLNKSSDNSYVRILEDAGMVSTISSAGDRIYDRLDNRMTADYLLVDFEDTSWKNDEDHNVRIEVSPKESGLFEIFYRMSFNPNATDPSNSNGDDEDQQDWKVYKKVVNVLSPSASLKVTLLNITENPTLPSIKGRVVLYDQSNGNIIGEYNTGMDHKTEIINDLDPSKTYFIEGYYDSVSPYGEEFWGSLRNITLGNGEFKQISLSRYLPYIYDIKVINRDTKIEIQKGTSIEYGTPLKFQIIAKRPDGITNNYTSKAELIIDDNGSLPFSNDPKQSEEHIFLVSDQYIGFEFEHNATEEGLLMFTAGLQTKIEGRFVQTDGWDFSNDYSITVKPDPKSVYKISKILPESDVYLRPNSTFDLEIITSDLHENPANNVEVFIDDPTKSSNGTQSVISNQNGVATYQIKIPDNLTERTLTYKFSLDNKFNAYQTKDVYVTGDNIYKDSVYVFVVDGIDLSIATDASFDEEIDLDRDVSYLKTSLSNYDLPDNYRIISHLWSGAISSSWHEVQSIKQTLTELYIKSKETNSKIIVVGHSWGTVLSYVALSELQDEIEIEKLILLSSPMGTKYRPRRLDDILLRLLPLSDLDYLMKALIINTTNSSHNDLGFNQTNTINSKEIKNYWIHGDLISGPLNAMNTSIIDREYAYTNHQNYVLQTSVWHGLTKLDSNYKEEELLNEVRNNLLEVEYVNQIKTPAPNILDISLSDSILFKNEPINIQIGAVNQGANAEYGSITVSFPEVQLENYHEIILIDDSKTDSNLVSFFPKGNSNLHNINGDKFTSEYLTIEFGKYDWKENEENMFSFFFIPPDTGKFNIQVRSNMGLESSNIYYNAPVNSSFKDQQEWPIVNYQVEVYDTNPKKEFETVLNESYLSLKPGESVTVDLEIKTNSNFEDDPQIQFQNVPTGLSIIFNETNIRFNEKIPIIISCNPNYSEYGPKVIGIKVSSDGVESISKLTINISRIESPPILSNVITIDSLRYKDMDSRKDSVEIFYTTQFTQSNQSQTSNWEYSLNGISWFQIPSNQIINNGLKTQGSHSIIWQQYFDSTISSNNALFKMVNKIGEGYLEQIEKIEGVDTDHNYVSIDINSNNEFVLLDVDNDYDGEARLRRYDQNWNQLGGYVRLPFVSDDNDNHVRSIGSSYFIYDDSNNKIFKISTTLNQIGSINLQDDWELLFKADDQLYIDFNDGKNDIQEWIQLNDNFGIISRKQVEYNGASADRVVQVQDTLWFIRNSDDVKKYSKDGSLVQEVQLPFPIVDAIEKDSKLYSVRDDGYIYVYSLIPTFSQPAISSTFIINNGAVPEIDFIDTIIIDEDSILIDVIDLTTIVTDFDTPFEDLDIQLNASRGIKIVINERRTSFITLETELNFNGETGFQISVSDGIDSITRDVQVFVNPINDPPFFKFKSDTLLIGFNESYKSNIKNLFGDIDDIFENLTYNIFAQNENVNVTVEDSILIIKPRNYLGYETVLFSVTDTSDMTSVDSLFINVESITSKEELIYQATEISLSQNCPNPFNPSTNITYSINEAVNVKLQVFNMLGQKVATLVNKAQNAGRYTVNFDAGGLSSGMYIYKLEAGNFQFVRKMLLIK